MNSVKNLGKYLLAILILTENRFLLKNIFSENANEFQKNDIMFEIKAHYKLCPLLCVPQINIRLSSGILTNIK